MTDELAARDAYLAVAEGTVVAAVDDGLVLDRTVFYPRGGGQPGDTGVIRWRDGAVRVLDTIHRDGEVVHLVAGDGTPEPGTAVTGEIDWPRRYLLMRTHTALHALSAVVHRELGAKVTGGNMEPGLARMDFELEAVSAELGRRIEEILNAELARDYPVEVRFLSRAEAGDDPDLIRTKTNLVPDRVSEVRVVDIVGLDRQADGGTHVRSTGEVGTVRVVKTESKGKANKRMRIELV